jgi:hypothetical protein
MCVCIYVCVCMGLVVVPLMLESYGEVRELGPCKVAGPGTSVTCPQPNSARALTQTPIPRQHGSLTDCAERGQPVSRLDIPFSYRS